MKEAIEGHLLAEGLRIGIVVARFNHFISDRLLEGALDALSRHGGLDQDIEIVKVPGAFEIPLAAKWLADKQRHDALICLGAVIRGSTPHFDFVAGGAAKGVAQIQLSSGIPIAFGVLTTDTIEQAVERAGTKAGNKGWEAALTAIEMADLARRLG